MVQGTAAARVRVPSIRRRRRRRLIVGALKLAVAASSPLMIWKGLMVVTNSEVPVLALAHADVTTFHAGDVLLVTNHSSIGAGDLVVFRVRDQYLAVHRVLRFYGGEKFLTKGDSNAVDDRSLYGGPWLERRQILGRVVAVFRSLRIIVAIVINLPRPFTFVVVASMVLSTAAYHRGGTLSSVGIALLVLRSIST